LKAVPASIGVGLLLSHCGGGAAVDGSIMSTGSNAVLPFAQFPALQSTGGGAVVDVNGGSPIAVIRTGATSAVALSAVCTHAGCTIAYQESSMDLACPCHGSVFNLSGQVTGGPAPSALRMYVATVNSSDITVALA
jgi:cytochrome b6-f complex iron-sulfur subunit